MSTTNNNVGRFQQKLSDNDDGVTKHRRQQQQHNIQLKCVHCGRHQTVTVFVPSNVATGACQTKTNRKSTRVQVLRAGASRNESMPLSAEFIHDITESKPPLTVSFRDLDSPRQTPAYGDVDDSSKLLRYTSVVDETNDSQNEITPTLHRSDYALQFAHYHNENDRKVSLERNINGLVGECVRSSVHEVSFINREGQTQDYVEVEFDPILGNVTATRKRSSTITTNLDNERYKPGYRHQSVKARYEPPPPLVNTERDEQPIWARRRLSHSTVKPSDLVREHDKKDKLQATALRRLSRADRAGDDVIPNSTSPFNPATIKDTILRWCQDCTQFYRDVNIRNFSSSWSDGLAFCALIHRYFPDEFNFETLRSSEPRENFDLAFTVARERAGIDPLIDTDDMLLMGKKPDWKVVFTYVQSIYRRLSRVQPPAIMRERW